MAKRFFKDRWTGNLKHFGWGYTRAASDEVSITGAVELTESETTPQGHVGREIFFTLTPARTQKLIISLQGQLNRVNEIIASGKGSSPEPCVLSDVTEPRYGIEPAVVNGEPRYAVVRYAGNQGRKVVARYASKIIAETVMKTLNESATVEDILAQC